MHIKFEIRWLFGTEAAAEIDGALFRLLEAVQRDGSLTRGAQAAGISYRHAWGLVRKWENRFNSPLLSMRRGRGRGARLTEFAERLLWARETVDSRVDGRLSEAAGELNEALDDFLKGQKTRVIRVAASHGMAIARLVELLRAQAGMDVQLQTRGSIESLRLLNRSECAVAGFHMPLDQVAEVVAPAYQRCLRGARFTLLAVANRQQGLMLARGNPKRVAALKDLTRRSVRFVNRQRDSGTRIILDALLDRAGIRADAVRGYNNEEFTHVAVAAMVASGAADAGFGIEAAAREFGLDFEPQVREAYYLALPRHSDALKRRIQRVLRSSAFRREVGALPGYDCRGAGTELSPDSLPAGSAA